jgi:4-hydroxy-3-polyprenylbenzoate decarboxylase
MTAGDKEWTASNTRFEGGMGIDATLPYGYETDFARPLYPIDRVELSHWFDQPDIERDQALMKGWVEVLARSGR